jgi:ferredoxin
MPELWIDGEAVKVESGVTVLGAATRAGRSIPSLCHRQECSPSTSCLVCLVKDVGAGRLIPSCTARAQDGMRIETGSDEVLAARRTALELLLSEHVGDCEAPCTLACPAHLDVPAMIRAIRAGDEKGAARIARRDLALPGVLSRLCHAPCEKVCRRKQRDGAVAIRDLERHAAELRAVMRCPEVNKLVAVVGGGPAGLAAAFELRMLGYGVIVFDARPAMGGTLHDAVADGALDAGALALDVGALVAADVKFKLGRRIGDLSEAGAGVSAVVVATGSHAKAEALLPGIQAGHHKAHATAAAGRSVREGVFVCGSALHPCRTVVHAVADGREAAQMADRYLRGGAAAAAGRRFNCHIGRVEDGEMAEFMKDAAAYARVSPAGPGANGLVAEESVRESARCLRCDCRRKDDCRLRDGADATGALQHRYRGGARAPVRRDCTHADLVLEPGKCIKCGLCVQVSDRAGERPGLAMLQRGYAVEAGVPFGGTLGEGLSRSAGACADVCPTGALARREVKSAEYADAEGCPSRVDGRTSPC